MAVNAVLMRAILDVTEHRGEARAHDIVLDLYERDDTGTANPADVAAALASLERTKLLTSRTDAEGVRWYRHVAPVPVPSLGFYLGQLGALVALIVVVLGALVVAVHVLRLAFY